MRRTCAHHPKALYRIHWQLEIAIQCHEGNNWIRILPRVFLGKQVASRKVAGTTVADIVNDQPLRLARDSDFGQLKPIAERRFVAQKTFIHWDFYKAKSVFLRYSADKNTLQITYDGPYSVPSVRIKCLTFELTACSHEDVRDTTKATTTPSTTRSTRRFSIVTTTCRSTAMINETCSIRRVLSSRLQLDL